MVGPVLRVEVAVHQELGEGEEAEDDVVGLHRPGRAGRDSLGHRGEVGGGVEVLAGQAQGVHALKEFLEGEIGGGLLRAGAQPELLTRCTAFEADGH